MIKLIKKKILEIKDVYKNSYIQYLIVFSFTSIAIVGILLSSGLLYFSFVSKAKQLVMSNNLQVISQANYNLDTYLRNIMKVSDTVYYRVLKNSDLDVDDIQEEINLLYESNMESTVSIGVFSDFGNVVVASPLSTLKKNVNVRGQKWFYKAANKIENIQFSTPHVQNLFEDPDYKYRWVVSLSRSVELTRSGDISHGVLLIDINFSGIEQICKSINLGDNGYVYLIDPNGEIIYHPKQQLIYSKIIDEKTTELIHYEDGNHIDSFEGQERLLSIKTVGYTGWKIIGVTPLKNITDHYKEIKLFLFISLLAAILIIIIINTLVSSKIAKPIKALENSVKDLDNELYNINIAIGGSYEIQKLGQTIQNMVIKMRKLMDDILIEQEAKRKNELDALQSQINPHFLYNTLDSIVWMVENERYEGAIEMVTSLAKLFRISLSKGKNIITLKAEIEHAENYLKIQKVRYKNKFDYKINVPENLFNCAVMKIIIQPLIENAIYHGIEFMDEDGEITINVYEKKEILYIDVTDNGLGMTKETAQNLLTDTSRKKSKGSGIGVKNVNERIKLYFGEKSGVEIYSEPDCGTTVSIKIPKMNYNEINF